MNEILAELKKITEKLESLDRRFKEKLPTYEETCGAFRKTGKSMKSSNSDESSGADVSTGTRLGETI